MTALPGSGVSAAAVEAPRAAASRGTHPYYVLALLFLAYTFSFVDRQILSILFEPIKAEMELSDTQLGFLGGLAFALFYSTLGVPIAMLADRSVRTRIITVSLVVFSAMTALCGLAQNFWHLALARVGVGVGEAGVNPASHSIIADIFPPAKRSTAMGLIAVGPNAGMLIGLAAGGILSVQYGWRVTIMAVGLPGLLLALIFWLTVREPRRGGSEARSADVAAPPVRESVVYMWRNRAMRHLVIGAMMKGIGGYGLVSWMPSFLIRTHELSAAQVGLLLGVGLGVIGGLGAFLGGYLNDRLSKRRAGAGLAVIAVVTAAVYPFSVGAYLVPELWLCGALLVFQIFGGGMYLAPSFALVQSLARLRMRSVAAAVKMLAINLIGLGLGPWAVGALSDMLRPAFGDDSLRIAMPIVGAFAVWGALHFYLSSRHLEEGLAEAQRD